jgi:hypothetical protein
MQVGRGNVVLVAALAGLAATPLRAQSKTGTAIPDFSGIWTHPSLGFESQVAGPGPVRNLSRLPNGAANFDMLIGDYTNPILKANATEIIKKRGEVSRSGRAFPDPDNQCQQQNVPYVFWNFEIELLQQPDKVTILYHHDHQFRQVPLSGPLSAAHQPNAKPTWHGDSVAHYEGDDTLVIDTVRVKVDRYTMVDRLGTPYTEAMHVIERYKLIDPKLAQEAQERGQKEWPRIPAYPIDTNYKGRGLQLEFTVEDPNVFTTPWKATITYRRSAHESWEEFVCAENIHQYYTGNLYYSEPDASVPIAARPDF